MLEYQLIVHLSTVVLYITRCEGLVFLVTSWSTVANTPKGAEDCDHPRPRTGREGDILGQYTTGSAHGGGDGGIQTLQSATVLL